jgi:hypothetical protein
LPTEGHSRIIDKAFRIGEPMRKASWTMRFAAGWGSVDLPVAIVECGQAG